MAAHAPAQGLLAPANTRPPVAAASADDLARHGVEAHARGDLEAAQHAYQGALALRPDHPLALHYLGVIRYQQGRLDEALEYLDRAVALVPHEPEFHNNRGLALAAAGRGDEAIAAYERTLALHPGHAGAWSNLGLARQQRRDVAGALAAFDRGLQASPDHPHLHWNRALALLLRGDARAGWREYEWRLRTPELAAALTRHASPRWTGDAPGGRRFLATSEQGLGDSLQHLRFIEPLAARGAHAIVVVPSTLARLAATVPGVADVVVEGKPLPAHDVQVPLLSLPHLLDLGLEDVPRAEPYLRADAQLEATASAQIAARGRRLNVGVAWTGAPGNTHNLQRSLPLRALAPMLAIDDVQFVSLKREGETFASDDRDWLPRLTALDMRNDFDGLAALVSSLDLVVSVDTSVAHLAGALGKPLWLPLAFVPDWRWLLDRPDSPWYPTARLFRQQAAGDWSGPVGKIAQALRERLHGR